MNRYVLLVLVTLLMMLPATAGAQSASDTVVMAVTDSLRSEHELRAASTRYAAAVRGCYEREGLRTDPALAATVDVEMTVQPDGSVREIVIDTVAVKGIGISSVAQCVAKAAATWRFSAGTYGLERAILTFRLVPPRTN